MDSPAVLRQRKRSDYPYVLTYRTRWSDNDMYDHLNNSIYNFLCVPALTPPIYMPQLTPPKRRLSNQHLPRPTLRPIPPHLCPIRPRRLLQHRLPLLPRLPRRRGDAAARPQARSDERHVRGWDLGGGRRGDQGGGEGCACFCGEGDRQTRKGWDGNGAEGGVGEVDRGGEGEAVSPV